LAYFLPWYKPINIEDGSQCSVAVDNRHKGFDMDDLDKALEIQIKAYNAINEIITNIVKNDQHAFPNYPLMVPTLCLAAICQCLNSYIDTFPDAVKMNLISMAYKTIGFAEFDQLQSLATMEVAGHA
jgi:hypothetical protein